jgi:hypothetical protein
MSVWGSLEAYMNVAISKLAGYEEIMDRRALIMVAHSTFQQRVDIVSTLCEQLVPEFPILADYKSVVSKIRAAQKARNKFAHNSIVTDEESGKVTISSATARGTLKTSIEVIKVDQIIDATAMVHEAMCELHTLITGKPLKPIWER